MKTRLAGCVAALALLAVAGAASAQGTLYGVVLNPHNLVRIDPAAVSATIVGPVGGVVLTGLAADAATNTIYGISPTNGALYKVNPATGATTAISGPLFPNNANGLAFDPPNNRLFVSDLNANALHSYNLTTGVATFLSNFAGATDIEGLAYDSSTQTLYGLSDGATEGVFKIDPSSGQTSLLATMTTSGIWRGLDIDPATGTLYATRVNPSMLTTVSVTTGAVTNLGPIAGIGPVVQGLAWMGGAACYPDCNGDGALNLGDFGCFQTKFALGDPYADCNGDGNLNLGDFGCFQTKFALGCP